MCIFVSFQDIVDWYTCIRSAKLNLLGLNKPDTDPEKVVHVSITL